MINRKRVLLMSASMILLCMCVIVGATYALFTDSETVQNHLQAGNLDIKFERTNLEYTVLNGDGFMVKHIYDDVVDFTETDTSDGNIFGISDGNRIVPGSYVKADLKVSHDLDADDQKTDSNVAFDYQVYLVFDKVTGGSTDTPQALAQQLYVTVTDKAGNVVVDNKQLTSDMFVKDTKVEIFFGEKVKLSDSAEFTVTIQFANVLDNGVTNNNAQDQTVYFDLIIEAQQSTSAPVDTVVH